LKSPPFFKASLTPSMKEFSDVPVHDAIRKLRHAMRNIVERLIVIVFIDANIRKIFYYGIVRLASFSARRNR
jgi:hypothetical protein